MSLDLASGLFGGLGGGDDFTVLALISREQVPHEASQSAQQSSSIMTVLDGKDFAA